MLLFQTKVCIGWHKKSSKLIQYQIKAAFLKTQTHILSNGVGLCDSNYSRTDLNIYTDLWLF